MATAPANRCCPTDLTAAPCVYTPAGEQMYMVGSLDSKAGVVLVGDIFGMMDNSKHFADILAAEGYLVVMPDFFGSRAWPADVWPPDFEDKTWKEFIAFATDMKPHVAKMKKAAALLRHMGCTKIGAAGMCWGAKPMFEVAEDNLFDAIATAHPSFFGADLLKSVKTPVCVLLSKDEGPMEDVEAAVKAHPYAPHVFKRFNNLHHGFFGARFDYDHVTGVVEEEITEARKTLFDFFDATLHK